MQSEIIIALLSFLGTAVGTLASSRLVAYRLAQLEKKVEKHNNVVERVFVLEGKLKEIERELNE